MDVFKTNGEIRGFFPLLFLAPFLWSVLLLCLVLVFLLYLKNAFKYLKCVHGWKERRRKKHKSLWSLLKQRSIHTPAPKSVLRYHFLREASHKPLVAESPTRALSASSHSPTTAVSKKGLWNQLFRCFPLEHELGGGQHHACFSHSSSVFSTGADILEALKK